MGKLTVGQLRKAGRGKRYIAVRTLLGYEYGVNCRVFKMEPLKSKNGNKETRFYSFREIDFMEYLTLKTPFI